MKSSNDVICKACKKIFCCADCRFKHELKKHAIIVHKLRSALIRHSECEINTTGEKIFLFCPICEDKPLTLHTDMYKEMLEHIEDNHLPLRCRKCAKIYTQIDDLQDFTKCLHPTIPCDSPEGSTATANESSDTDVSKVTVTKAATTKITISTQTSPPRRPNNDTPALTTPFSILNLHWKAVAKNKLPHEEFISDSVSSIKNISSISNCSTRRSIDAMQKPKAKIVRTTSTPVHAELLCCTKTKQEQTIFNATGGQVSSIYNSGCDSDNSPALLNPSRSSPKQSLDNINRYLKVGGRGKMAAVTPLRQVMSKSIQKAFAEHGGLPTANAAAEIFTYNRKKMFNSIDNTSSSTTGIVGSPLDLRLSPVVRRTQSEIYYSSNSGLGASSLEASASHLHRELLCSSQKLTTESIVITRMQHLASIESISTTDESGGSGSSLSSIAINAPTNKSAATSNASSSSSGISTTSATSSMFRSCHSVEIIASSTTELSQVNVENNKCYASIENIENIHPLHKIAEGREHNVFAAAITPTTRILPGAIINKKLIKFDTPTPNLDERRTAQSIEQHSLGEMYFTPNSTPIHKSNLNGGSVEKRTYESNGNKILPRNLSERFSPYKRPSLRDYAENGFFNRIEDSNGTACIDDEVFLTEEEQQEKYKAQKAEENDTHKKKATHGSVEQTGRSWSFGSLIGTVMRLSSLTGTSRNKDDIDSEADINANSLIERCAFMAGSLVRSKTLIDDEKQETNLKRKRTYHKLNSSPISPNSDASLTSSKRFRIEGRRPIDRMRLNTGKQRF